MYRERRRYEIPEVRVAISKKLALAITFLVIFIVVAALVAMNVITASLGEAKVIIDPFTGNVRILIGPGWTIKMPWEDVRTFSVAVTAIDFIQSKGTSIPALTKDGAEVLVDVTIRAQLRPDPEALIYVARYYPQGVIEPVLIPKTRAIVRDVISQYTLVEVIEKRFELSEKIRRALEEAFKKDKTISLSLIIHDIAVRNIIPPTKVREAIEEKLAAQQRAEAAKYERERTLTLANATAMQKILAAKGEAEAYLLRTSAEVKAIEMLLRTLGNDTRALLTYLYIRALEDALMSGRANLILVASPTGATTPTLPLILPIPQTTQQIPRKT